MPISAAQVNRLVKQLQAADPGRRNAALNQLRWNFLGFVGAHFPEVSAEEHAVIASRFSKHQADLTGRAIAAAVESGGVVRLNCAKKVRGGSDLTVTARTTKTGQTVHDVQLNVQFTA